MTIKTLKRFPEKEIVEMGSIVYGLKTTFFSCFNVIANRIDATLIFFILSPTSLAIYAIAERIAEIAKEGINDVGLILAPKFAKQKGYTERLHRILKIFSFFSALGIVLFSFFILPTFIEVLFGEAYLPSIPYAQVLLCSIAIAIFHNLQFRYIMSKLDTQSFRDYSIYTSLIRIVLSVALIPFWGIWGAVMSTFLYRTISVGYIEFLMRRKYKVK